MYDSVKRLVSLFLAALFLMPAIVFATPSSVDRITDHIEPLIKTDYIKGSFFIASSTSATSTFPVASSTKICIGTDCRTAWPAAGTTLIATSSAETSGRVPFWTSTAATPATLSGGVAGFAFNSGTATLTLTNLSLTAGTTTSFFATVASSTNLFSQTAQFGSLTVTSATTTNLHITSITSAVLLNDANGRVSAASTQTCTNQFVRAMSALYVATCAAVNLATDVTGTLSVGSGGTGATTFTAGSLLYGAGTGAVQTVATSSYAVSSAFSHSGTLGALVGGTGGTLSNVTNPSFTYSTSTAFTGTTTLQFVVDQAFTLNGVRCRPRSGVGTLNVHIGNGTASTTLINASSTVNYNAFSANNAFTAGSIMYIDIGTPATSPTGISCTQRRTV